MRKVVIATPLYPPEIGGPATYAQILERELPKKAIDVTLVKFSDVRHLPKLVRHYAYYRRVCEAAHHADVIFALDPVSTGFPAMRVAKKLGKKFIVKIVGDYAWEQGRQRFGVTQDLDTFVRTKQRSLAVRLMQSVQTRVARAADRVVVPSEYLKRVVTAWGVPAEKVTVIYNSIEVPQHLVLPEKRPDEFLIVSSGRRVPWKGFEALERVAAREPRWRVFIASGLSREEALGWVKAADVYVLNSRYEGLSHALLEALALGTPIIATNAGGNGEVVRDNETGLLIPAGDGEALYDALKKVAEDKSGAQARADRGQEAAKIFSVDAMVDRTERLLKYL